MSHAWWRRVYQQCARTPHTPRDYFPPVYQPREHRQSSLQQHRDPDKHKITSMYGRWGCHSFGVLATYHPIRLGQASNYYTPKPIVENSYLYLYHASYSVRSLRPQCSTVFIDPYSTQRIVDYWGQFSDIQFASHVKIGVGKINFIECVGSSCSCRGVVREGLCENVQIKPYTVSLPHWWSKCSHNYMDRNSCIGRAYVTVRPTHHGAETLRIGKLSEEPSLHIEADRCSAVSIRHLQTPHRMDTRINY